MAISEKVTLRLAAAVLVATFALSVWSVATYLPEALEQVGRIAMAMRCPGGWFETPNYWSCAYWREGR